MYLKCVNSKIVNSNSNIYICIHAHTYWYITIYEFMHIYTHTNAHMHVRFLLFKLMLQNVHFHKCPFRILGWFGCICHFTIIICDCQKLKQTKNSRVGYVIWEKDNTFEWDILVLKCINPENWSNFLNWIHWYVVD